MWVGDGFVFWCLRNSSARRGYGSVPQINVSGSLLALQVEVPVMVEKVRHLIALLFNIAWLCEKV